ncbi:hypothetical protein ABZ885_35305, partial [Kitasatospora sp. NPDC047058]
MPSPRTRVQRDRGKAAGGDAPEPRERSTRSGQPEQSRQSGQPEKPGRPGQPEKPGRSGVPSPRTRVQRDRGKAAGQAAQQGAGGPATRVQRPGPTAGRDAPATGPDAPTRVQRPGRGPAGSPAIAATPQPATRRASGSGDTDGDSGGGADAGAFPAALTDRYQPYGVAGSGSEGTVWHVRRTDDGTDAAVKVAAPGQPMDPDLLEHLRNDAFRGHVPEIHDHGRVHHAGALCDWVAMEYLPTTLADHLAGLRRAGRLSRGRDTERIVRGLVGLLAFWQSDIERNPVDFKPANILVRTGRGPTRFVIADFGGVDRLTASRRFTPDMQLTVPYMAPEQLIGNNHPAGPWWALGNVLFELFTGRPRFVRADGGLVSDEAVQYGLLMDEEVDLSAVTDQRQLLLLQGLFTKDPADRWTAAQVREWLAGGSPEVVRSRARATGATGPAHRPIGFGGEYFHDPAALAVALLARSSVAAKWLAADGGARRLRTWLHDEVKDTVLDLDDLDAVDRAGPASRARAASVAVLALGAAFAPDAVPYYRDRRVDAAGLAQVAGEPDAVAFVDELIAGSAPAVLSRYHCGHPGCTPGRCERLLALTRLPAVLAGVEREARALGNRPGARTDGSGNTRRNRNGNGNRNGTGNGSGTGNGNRDAGANGGLTAAERTTAHRLAVRLTVQPEQRALVVGRFSPLPAALRGLPVPAHAAASTVTGTVAGASRA